MRETFTTNTTEQAYPSINPQDVEQLISGDPNAADAVYSHLAPRLFQYFLAFNRGISPIDADLEDVTQEALIKIFASAPKFPKSGEGSIESQFERWSFAIARNSMRSYQRRLLNRNETLFPIFDDETIEEALDSVGYQPRQTDVAFSDQDEKDSIQRYKEKLLGWIDTHVSALQARIVRLRLMGKRNIEISESLHIGLETIMQQVEMARGIIETDLLAPAGIYRLMKFRDSTKPGFTEGSLHSAASLGQIDVIKLLDVKYTSQESIDHYSSSRPESVKASAAIAGRLALSDAVSPTEYAMLLRQENSHFLYKENGRYYITPAARKAFRKELRGMYPEGETYRQVDNIPEGYITLAQASTTQRDYSMYLGAIRRNTLHSIKVDKRWLVRPADIALYKRTHKKSGQTRFKKADKTIEPITPSLELESDIIYSFEQN